MSKLMCEWDRDHTGRNVLVLSKKRGRIPLSEICEFLLYERHLHGHYAFIISVTESMFGGSGWMDEVVPEGDRLELFEYTPGDDCPLCGQLAPPEHCPHCGEQIDEKYGTSAWRSCMEELPPLDTPVLFDYDPHCNAVVARLAEQGGEYFFVADGIPRKPDCQTYWMPQPARARR